MRFAWLSNISSAASWRISGCDISLCFASRSALLQTLDCRRLHLGRQNWTSTELWVRFGSAKAACNCTSFTSCDSENTTGSLAEEEPTDSANGLGRQEGSEGSSVNLTSRLSGRSGSKPETLYKRVDVLVTREETVEKPDLMQTELSVEALMSFLVCETGDDVRRTWPRDTRCSAPEIELYVGTVHVAGFAFQALVMTKRTNSSVSFPVADHVHAPPPACPPRLPPKQITSFCSRLVYHDVPRVLERLVHLGQTIQCCHRSLIQVVHLVVRLGVSLVCAAYDPFPIVEEAVHFSPRNLSHSPVLRRSLSCPAQPHRPPLFLQ